MGCLLSSTIDYQRLHNIDTFEHMAKSPPLPPEAANLDYWQGVQNLQTTMFGTVDLVTPMGSPKSRFVLKQARLDQLRAWQTRRITLDSPEDAVQLQQQHITPHPHITPLVLTWHDQRRHLFCILQHYYPNGDLVEYINRYTDAPQHARRWFRQMVSALHHLHVHCNVVHLDLSPENIVLDHRLNAHLIDFGRAKQGTLTMTRPQSARAPLMPPETHFETPFATRPLDVWALGIILFTTLYGTYPWKNAVMTDPNFNLYVHRGLQPLLQHLALEPVPGTTELLELTLQINPHQRPTTDQLTRHLYVLLQT